MLAALSAKRAAPTVCAARALHIGYPHLLKGLQGEALRTFIIEGSNVLQAASGVAPLVSIDINGATLGTAGDADGVLAPALGHVDLLHGNLDEICHLVGSTSLSEATATDDELRRLVAPLLSSGVAIVAVTREPDNDNLAKRQKPYKQYAYFQVHRCYRVACTVLSTAGRGCG